MSTEFWLWIALVLAGAAWLMAHLLVVWTVLRSSQPMRWLALVPPVAPVLAWKDSRRTLPILWFVLLVAYFGLRVSV